MELSIKQRMLLLNLLAEYTGNIAQLRILAELRDRLSFSEEEHERFEIKQEGNQLSWSPEKAAPTEVEIGPVAKEIIVRRLRDLSNMGQMTLEFLELVDLFPQAEA